MDAQTAMTAVMLVASVVALAVLRRRGALSRDAFHPPKREIDALSAGAWAGVGLLVYLGWFVGMQVAAGAASLSPGDDSLRARALVMIGMYLGGGAALGLVWPLLGRRLVRGGFRLDGWDLPRGLGAFLLVFPMISVVAAGALLLAGWIASARGLPAPDLVGHVTLSALIGGDRDFWWWCIVGAVVVGAPVVEEVIWRGGVQSALRRAPVIGEWGKGWGAIALSSLLFTLMHLGDAATHTLPSLFALAVAMGVVFERTGRLGSAIVMHAGFNALNIAIALVQSAS